MMILDISHQSSSDQTMCFSPRSRLAAMLVVFHSNPYPQVGDEA